MSLLKQIIIRKEKVDKIRKLETGDNGKEYKIEAIWNNAIYTKELESYLPGLYYLIAWKGYLEEENTWKPILIVQYLRKLISLFYKDHFKKPIATIPFVNFALLMAKSTVKPTKPTKEKWGQLANNANKWVKKN